MVKIVRARGTEKVVQVPPPAHTLHVQRDQISVPSEHHSVHASSNNQTESKAQPGLKRKAADDEDVLHGKRTSNRRSNKERKRSVVQKEEDRRKRRRRWKR